MKNYIQPGNVIAVTAPTGGVASGDGVLVGSLFGIAAGDAAENDNVEVQTTGVFELSKVTGAISQGAKVYWDDTNKRTTSVATSNTLIGVATEAVAGGAGDTIGRVRLNASF